MKILVALFVLWLPFSIVAILSVPISLIALITDEWPYAKKVLKAMDKLMAAILGWDGTYTISAECGRSSCTFCNVICWILNKIQPGHCVGAAEREIKK